MNQFLPNDDLFCAPDNDPEALYSLAWVYEHGELGQTRDHHKALDLLDEAMEHAYLEELLPLAVALTYFQSHDIYLRVVGFVEGSKRGFVGALDGVVAQGDTILLLVLSTILFWVVARLRRRLNQVEHRTLGARTIEVSGAESVSESVPVSQPPQLSVAQGGVHLEEAAPLVGQVPNESRDGDPGASGYSHPNTGRPGDLRHRSASTRAQG